MKTLGLIGGTSWHSTVDYYRLINRGVHERLGEVNAARLVMFSLNMQEFKNIIDAGGWKAGENYLVPFAQKLEAFGAEGLVMCANTPHIVADGIRAAVSIPLIHIVEATALVLAQKNVSTVGVLGTTFTMEQPFYRDMLEKHGIKMIVPEPEDRAWINDNIFGELAAGVFRDETKQRYKELMRELGERGAQAVALACTEIPVLIKPEECPIPAFDTIAIHANAAVEWMLG
ncbi:aspartate/glutamate racemase family protein [bacterium]|nr:aspartate/glutamate racemase family protein [bacterium]